MQGALLSPLALWQNFYVIIGSAAATLTGLMFVAITLITRPRRRAVTGGGIAAFSTPTIVHFCAALLVAATLSAPWQVLWNVSILLSLCGLGGIIYVIIVLQRARHQTGYQPVLEDWLWHTIFPFISYTAFLVAAIVLPGYPTPALFVIGAAMILLLFIGIHNAWDNVTYLIIADSQQEGQSQGEVKERAER